MTKVTYAKIEDLGTTRMTPDHLHIAKDWEPMPTYPNWLRGLCTTCRRWVEITKDELNG